MSRQLSSCCSAEVLKVSPSANWAHLTPSAHAGTGGCSWQRLQEFLAVCSTSNNDLAAMPPTAPCYSACKCFLPVAGSADIMTILGKLMLDVGPECACLFCRPCNPGILSADAMYATYITGMCQNMQLLAKYMSHLLQSTQANDLM